ncbi:alpha-1,4-glucan--maltose-1-phosphate maltosyltransferase [Robertkochia flava]|uniref:alpha-1,4-glucan--maltose-1-phosphate maltosyltransferase n=1 Tax=Robertkochia flava TaxID=3447986 RepID=UPI001CC93BF6|nr:alpha-1,4-glucan--maltose-1-phosphate maltosyltransferase [Robertkochia marina]
MQDQTRIIIENVNPQLQHGDFYIKRVTGETVDIGADVFADGHDIIACVVRYKHENERSWKEERMEHRGNDYWTGRFRVEKQGLYTYHIEGWVDYALNWQYGITRKLEDGQHVRSELLEGATYLEEIAGKCSKKDKDYLRELKAIFEDENQYQQAVQEAVSERLKNLFLEHPVKFLSARSKDLKVYVDRSKALFSTWYEFFPRSASPEAGKHGTFKDCERLLPRIARMGFDVLYFPPVHPIGEVNRKGKNNSTVAGPGDVGSPWGIGSEKGGHKSLHPELGTAQDFKDLVQKAKEHGIEIAMDFALQCAPDHPYVKEHPSWFKWRPDGTVQYAENPPKKYQDILPIYFETPDWKNLWKELLSIALYWVEEFDIRIFRVDNPHTKPFKFWGWLIAEVKKKHPDVLFLSEAFTRPKVMHELARQGFTQSYTYFTWRNNKEELMAYVKELSGTEQREFFRPNFWPNTPDINPYPLQGGNESIFMQRYFLAATLSSNTGVYGPVYEQMVSDAVPGKEEYLDSEKYEVRYWNWEQENKLTHIITKINHARKQHQALQQTNNILFCDTDNDQLMAWYKYDEARQDEILMVVNLDAYYSKQGWVRLPLQELGVSEGQQIKMHDLITGSTYVWDKEWNYVELHPALPFHLFQILK